MDASPTTLLSLVPWLRLLVLLLLPLLSLIVIVKQGKKKPAYNLPPGPRGLPIIGNLLQLGVHRHQNLKKIADKYGPVIHLNLGQISLVVVSSPQTAEVVMKTHDADCCSRPHSNGTRRLSYNFLDFAFAPYSDYWREIRKICVLELLTAKKVHSFGDVREDIVTNVLDDLTQRAGKPVHLTEVFANLTNDVICSIGFGGYRGQKFQCDELKDILDEGMAMLSSFWGSDFFPRWGWILDVAMGLHSRLEKTFQQYDKFLERLLVQHMDPAREKPDKEDLVDILLRLSKDEKSPVRLTKEHIKAVLFDIYIGATDTTSVSLTWAMAEVVKNPRVMKKVQAEVRSYGQGKRQIGESEADKIPYLNMVVKETFRLHAPAALVVPREAMRHFKINGYDIPPKTRILVNAWAIGRDPNTWKDPELFYPERFETKRTEIFGQNHEILPFGSGRRVCPGAAMGNTAVHHTLANLLLNFDWELPGGMKPEDFNMDEAPPGLTVRKKEPLYLVPTKYNRP